MEKIDTPVDHVKLTVATHETVVLGKKVLFVPSNAAEGPKKLLIVMSAHNQGTKYMALRSFLENQLCDLLFVSDPKNSWYLDEDYGETYQNVLKHFAKNYEPENVFLFGSSMSGYGAILHALKLNANAIASNPQVNLDISKDYAWDELKEHLDDLGGKHINIDEHLNALWRDSAIYLIHGHDEIDVINVGLLSQSTPPNKKMIIQTLDLDTHVMFFGKDVSYVYSAMDLLSNFRSRLNLKTILKELMPEDKTNRRERRGERTRSTVADPYRSLKAPVEGVLWQHRHLHEIPGRQVFFSNVGFYFNGALTGAMCFYDGARWRLSTPVPTINDNLIAKNHCATRSTIINPLDNQRINDDWWIRNDKASELTIDGLLHEFKIDLKTVNSKNIYINSPAKLERGLYDSLYGKYVTLSAEAFSTSGEGYLTLGGVGDAGYHHRNSPKWKAGTWQNIFVCEQFLSIKPDHKDAIFVRANLCPDGKPKTVYLRNFQLNIGYFPMGLA